MTHYLTIFHNAAVLPVGESVLCDGDPSVYLGTPDSEAGSMSSICVSLLVVTY